MMKCSALVLFAAFGMTIYASAQPVVSDVTLSQDPGSCMVTVEYRLSQTAIVTVDFLTNGVSIGGARFNNVAGDVHKVVVVGDGDNGEIHRMWWRPESSWPNMLLPRDLPVTARVTAWATNTPPNYMVIHIDKAVQHISASARTTYYETADALPFPGGVTNDLCKTDYIVFRKCPAANVKFRRGATANECNITESRPAHYVALTNNFYIGIYEMTQGQYEHFGVKHGNRGSRPSFFTEEYKMRPVEDIRMIELRGLANYDENDPVANGNRKYWPEYGHDIVQTNAPGVDVNALWRIREITGQKFDLPTDAQWEFAARAGVGGVLPDGEGSADIENRTSRYSRCEATAPVNGVVAGTSPSVGGTAVVGSYEPNAWGIYDMTGNVDEMCLDNYARYGDESDFNEDLYVDPAGLLTSDSGDKGALRVVRGGSWKIAARYAIIPRRYYFNPSNKSNIIGFRLCLTLP